MIHNECKDKTNDNVSDKNIDKKVSDDKIDIKTTRKSTDAIINISAISDDSSITTKDETKKHFETETNVELKKKEKLAHSSRSTHHKDSKSSNRLKVPADKTTQFKTAEILKSYLMRYYPSERLPDRATFSKTCREMHYDMLKKKIFDKEGIHDFVVSFMRQS